MKRITSAPEALIAAIVAVVVVVVAPAGAQGQDHPRGFGSSVDDKTALVYGVPGSD